VSQINLLSLSVLEINYFLLVCHLFYVRPLKNNLFCANVLEINCFTFRNQLFYVNVLFTLFWDIRNEFTLC